MTDRELLELAAKAVGLAYEWNACAGAIEYIPAESRHYVRWKPLTDDGDALRLAVKLNFLVQVRPRVTFVTDTEGNQLDFRQHKDDPYAATRRAIVRAAAEIQLQKERT